jgi:hypothetical protein
MSTETGSFLFYRFYILATSIQAANQLRQHTPRHV